MADDLLPLSVIKPFDVVADYYNTKERIFEELQFWYDDKTDAFIDKLDKSYLKIITIRSNKTKKKVNSKSINLNYASKLKTLTQTAIALHNTFNNINNNQTKIRLSNIDKCILYYSRGKLKGLPSRIHLQMILYGYSPHKKQITDISKHINEYMDIINSENKMKTFRNKMQIDTIEQKQLNDKEMKYNLNHNNHKNKKNNQFVDNLNINWSPPMSEIGRAH
eukprot:370977_1